MEAGLARSVLALPAPRMLALTGPALEESGHVNIFTKAIKEQEIVDVCRDLFASGHYSLAVQEAFKAVEKMVQTAAQENGQTGTKLMDLIFSPNAPRLIWSDRQTQSEKDEQHGYHRLFSGAMLGIRNPVTHEFNWIEEAEIALELIFFAQHLIRKAKIARPP